MTRFRVFRVFKSVVAVGAMLLTVAMFALMVTAAILASGCGEAPTAPTSANNPNLTAIDEEIYLGELGGYGWVAFAEWDCARTNDLLGSACCPWADPETGRGPAVSTVRGDDQDVVIFGPNRKMYPFFVAVDKSGRVRYIIRGEIDLWRKPPYPSDVPAYFFDFTGIPEDVQYGLPVCPNGEVTPLVTPEHAVGSGLTVVELTPELGWVWRIPR